MNTFLLCVFTGLCFSPVLFFTIGFILWYSHNSDPANIKPPMVPGTGVQA